MGSVRAENRCLIVGCGYVGKPLALSLVAQGWQVGAVVKSDASRRALSGGGFEVFQGDVADNFFWSELEVKWNRVVYCPSTGGGGVEVYRQIHDIGLINCIKWMPREARLVYTSSTSVYGQDDGAEVDEASPTEPLTESGQELVKAEQRVCAAGQIVLRLGGIYGPDRGVLLKRLLEGKATIPEQDPKWLNLIYLTDIISAIEHGLTGNLTGGQVYNAIDDEPSAYRSIYEWLCEKLELPLPPTGTPEYFGKRGITNKRVSNRKLRQTGWQPKCPNFRAGYIKLIVK